MSTHFNPYKQFSTVPVPSWLLDKSISPSAKLMYGLLIRYAGRAGYAWPRQDRLAVDMGLSLRQTNQCITDLVAAGLIESRRYGLGRPNRYYFLRHEWMNSDHDPDADPLPPPPSPSGDEQRDESAEDRVADVQFSARVRKEVTGRRSKEVVEDMSSRLDGAASKDAVREVFDHWVAVSGKSRATFSSDRTSHIRARLRSYTVEQLKAVIDSAHRNPYYLGENDRKTYYGDPVTIFKNDSSVDRHLEWAEKNPPQDGANSFGKLPPAMQQWYLQHPELAEQQGIKLPSR